MQPIVFVQERSVLVYQGKYLLVEVEFGDFDVIVVWRYPFCISVPFEQDIIISIDIAV